MRSETWDIPADRLDLEPVLAICNQEGLIQISVGIPAYKREEKLVRCLESVASQASRPFKVIVSNDDPHSDIRAILEDGFARRFAALEVYQQPENLGSLANFNFLLRKADTEYFMWLANDDEISETWIEDLARLLDADTSAAGAMGDWVFGNSETTMRMRAQFKHDNRSRLLRLLKFVWRADDAFYYGLFRREALMRGGFPGYFWPNKGYIRNWCYVFLVGPLSWGRMVYSDTCRWINHDYGEKHYPASPTAGSKLFHLLSVAIRRINVHWLYAVELMRSNPVLSILTIPVSAAALARDGLQFSVGLISRKLRS